MTTSGVIYCKGKIAMVVKPLLAIDGHLLLVKIMLALPPPVTGDFSMLLALIATSCYLTSTINRALYYSCFHQLVNTCGLPPVIVCMVCLPSRLHSLHGVCLNTSEQSDQHHCCCFSTLNLL